jgi:hypothetical protein
MHVIVRGVGETLALINVTLILSRTSFFRDQETLALLINVTLVLNHTFLSFELCPVRKYCSRLLTKYSYQVGDCVEGPDLIRHLISLSNTKYYSYYLLT